MFNVLRLIYVQIGDSGVIRWEVIGQAKDMADAKRRFGGSPVLEKVR
jgi:hypothetical protein